MSEKHYLGGGTCHVHGVVHVGEAQHHLLYHVLQHVRACAGKVMRLYTTRGGREAESKPRVLPRSRSNSPVQESGRFRTGPCCFSSVPSQGRAIAQHLEGSLSVLVAARLRARTLRLRLGRFLLSCLLCDVLQPTQHAAHGTHLTKQTHIAVAEGGDVFLCGVPGHARRRARAGYPGGYPATKTQHNLGRTSGHCASRAPSAVFPTFASTAAWDAGHKNA